jgi:hypothetical protein
MTDFLPEYRANALFAGGSNGDLIFGEIPSTALAAQLAPFYKGDKGDKGDRGDPTIFVSTDPDNRLRLGSDAGMYVPDDLVPDPLAYYILAKA